MTVAVPVPPAAGFATCPASECLTTIPLDGRAACYFHSDAPRHRVSAPSLLVRPCACGGTIDARATGMHAAVRTHNETSQHMRWALGLMPPFNGRRAPADGR